MPLQESKSTFFIPPGKEMVIKSGNQNIFYKYPNVNNIHLIIDGGLTLSFKNTYAKLVDVKSSSLLNLLSNSITVNDQALPSGQFALQGLEAWESTDNLSFSIDATLNMVTSAIDDVMNPSLNLISTTLPSKDTKKKGIWGNSLIPPGPNIAKILELSGVSKEDLQKVVQIVSLGGLLDIEVTSSTGTYDIDLGGYLTIPDVIITSIEPTYAEQLDEELCPISCKLSIQFQTVEVATKQMISQILKSLPTNNL